MARKANQQSSSSIASSQLPLWWTLASTTNLPISQLTRYQLDGPWEEHKRILKLAPNLVEADITADFDDQSWRGVDKIIDLPSLRRRYVSDPGTPDYLWSPSLEALALYISNDDSADDTYFAISRILP
jgi:hypothetical protein